jgi:hypothetical protein
MPPFVIAERKDEPLLMVVPPQIDKHMALDAAAICRRGMASDAITIITDGYCLSRQAFYGKEKEVSREEWEEVWEGVRKKYNNSLFDAFQDGCEYVGEAITAMRCNEEKEFICMNAEYEIKDGKISWFSNSSPLKSTDEGAKIEGLMPDGLRQIMAFQTVFEMPELVAAQNMLDFHDPEKILYHSGRAVRQLLHQKDYFLLECIVNEGGNYGDLLRAIKEKYDEVEDIYDFKEMKTKPEFLKKFEPGDN